MMTALPTGTFDRIDRVRRWTCYRKAGIVFVHVPKAAGSSVATVLYGRRLGHHPAARLQSEDPAGWRELDKFAILREPVARFSSAFAFVMDMGTRDGAVRWRPEYAQPSFKDINHFVRDYLLQGSIYDKDVVFWPQTYFVCDGSGRPFPGLRLFTTTEIDAVERLITAKGHAKIPRINRGRAADHLQLQLQPGTRTTLEHLYAADVGCLAMLKARQ